MAYIRRESDVNNRPFSECGYKYRVSVRLVSVRVLERKCSSSSCAERSAQSADTASNMSSSHNMSILHVLYLYEISKRNTVNTISYINTVNCYNTSNNVPAARLFLVGSSA